MTKPVSRNRQLHLALEQRFKWFDMHSERDGWKIEAIPNLKGEAHVSYKLLNTSVNIPRLADEIMVTIIKNALADMKIPVPETIIERVTIIEFSLGVESPQSTI